MSCEDELFREVDSALQRRDEVAYEATLQAIEQTPDQDLDGDARDRLLQYAVAMETHYFGNPASA